MRIWRRHGGEGDDEKLLAAKSGDDGRLIGVVDWDCFNA
jgi:hypothetical protein